MLAGYLSSDAQFLINFGMFVVAIIGVIVTYSRFRFELTRFRQDVKFSLDQTAREIRTDERGQYRLAMEERRLGEANVAIRPSLTIIPSPAASPFLLFRIRLRNEGDGPVDILASLVSARVLSNGHTSGVGLRGRDVEWEDYQTYYWAEASASAPFAGISTTKNMLARPTHYIRLFPHEQASLRRIDAVNHTPAFTTGGPYYLMYRAFLVIRGYPLGEIMRQLGGESPDPVKNANLDKVQFESIAQPTYWRWRQVQEALLNLNRTAFRIATGQTGALDMDPLGELTEQDAWRFFLLFHKDFANDSVGARIAQATERVRTVYGGTLSLPPDFRSAPQFQTLQAECAADLRDMLTRWEHLKRIIRECRDYTRGSGYAGYPRPNLPPQEMEQALEDGYAARIHQDPDCRERWLALFDEGYLISKPLEYKSRIPADPRVLEPYVMRIHYFLESTD